MKRGEIYLVNFGKKYNSEFGKVRPALIIQNDIANRVIDKVAFKGVTLLPLTSWISGGSLRVVLKARDHLLQDSEICINELCTLDLSRIDLSRCLTVLTPRELKEVEQKLCLHLGVGTF
ncbi:type II toxin-antitoxin system PemK/MazF family toxin [Nitratifractor salsuginis]|uniref:Transcriptional modulator of MazE/toxin, MazF n=1 Tax=Nitratifractor salsuginis (strain DSM 16511 / JCM 12458 / E9I37-1) TaxID=749222 RepID=E6X1V0_NITSE|nr:type II toxin-antitoxin system PemK/MazF family toxin [Nitratifractor salsuginis]ADV45958.1 transcriptional modulator of MazE/toxin, MazF [Nitratifractor salsuginis DSM 16511]